MTQPPNQSEIVLYTTKDGKVKIDTIFQNETIWLTQKKMAELFDVQRPAITKHLKNIFESGELAEQLVSSILEHTSQHGAIDGKTQTQSVKYYNLDAFLEFNEQKLLTHAGKVKAEVARRIAEGCYEEFDNKRKKLEALAADEEDLKQLEEIEKKLLDNRGRRHE